MSSHPPLLKGLGNFIIFILKLTVIKILLILKYNCYLIVSWGQSAIPLVFKVYFSGSKVDRSDPSEWVPRSPSDSSQALVLTPTCMLESPGGLLFLIVYEAV